jgi:hypothetical protein
MAEWIVDAPTDPIRFPRVQHRHPNGTLPVERDRTPTIVEPLGGPRVERWSHVCACGEVYVWERKPLGTT